MHKLTHTHTHTHTHTYTHTDIINVWIYDASLDPCHPTLYISGLFDIKMTFDIMWGLVATWNKFLDT